jgi:hypothetical protein
MNLDPFGHIAVKHLNKQHAHSKGWHDVVDRIEAEISVLEKAEVEYQVWLRQEAEKRLVAIYGAL